MSSHVNALAVERIVVRRVRNSVFALAFSVFLPALAAADPLSLSGAQQRAVERSRLLAAQDLAAAAARDMAVAAARLPDPVLKLGVDNYPIQGNDRFSFTRDSMTMRRIGVMQEFTRIDKRQLRAERFEREADKSLAEKSAVVANLRRDVALAWLDAYYTDAMAQLIDSQIAQAKLEIDAAGSAYRAGRGSQAELLNARNALAMLEDRATDIRSKARNARTMLARWIGTAADMRLADKPPTDSIPLHVDALDAQLAHHPEISVLGKQVAVAETEARLAQADKNADWSVELMFNQRGPAYDNMISVGVSIPLQWDQKNRQDRELSARLAQLEQAQAQRDEALRMHAAELRTMLNEWEARRERGARYRRDLIPLGMQRTQAMLAAYRGGKASLAEALGARRDEIEIRMQALQLELETDRLWAQLNFLYPANEIVARPVNKEIK